MLGGAGSRNIRTAGRCFFTGYLILQLIGFSHFLLVPATGTGSRVQLGYVTTKEERRNILFSKCLADMYAASRRKVLRFRLDGDEIAREKAYNAADEDAYMYCCGKESLREHPRCRPLITSFSKNGKISNFRGSKPSTGESEEDTEYSSRGEAKFLHEIDVAISKAKQEKLRENSITPREGGLDLVSSGSIQPHTYVVFPPLYRIPVPP